MLAEQHTLKLPTFSKHTPSISVTETPSSPKAIAQAWLDKFSAVLSSGDALRLSTVLHTNSWWRDTLAFSWDLRTLQGLPKITEYLSTQLAETQMTNLKLQDRGKFSPTEATPIDGLDWVEAMFSFETKVGTGKAMVRLVQGSDGAWKGYIVYTALQDLKSVVEEAGYNRKHGGSNSLDEGGVRGNWLERRERRKEFLDQEPKVLIIGAGQSGLNLGARFETMGFPSLIIDKNQRIGDNWRNRYRTLVTHDPVQYTHMAYLPFPSNWPLFTPKDKLGDWFEAYASLMELNIWTSTTIESASYDDASNSWTVTITRNSSTKRTLHPKHVVFCTGHSGEPKIPTFPGQDSFKGTTYHGSQHKDASTYSGSLKGKRVIVIGTGNSGHDIAQNYYENGASVTMVQRRPTYVLQAHKGLFLLHDGLYDESTSRRETIEDCDVYGQSLPIPVQFALNVGLTNRIKELEKENLEGLEKAGFKLDYGPDGSGIFRKYVTRGGGYYIDVGCSRLICEGKVKAVQSPDGIKGFETDALVLADGRRLEADVVVMATGYDNMKTSVEKALGPEEAGRCRDVWDLDEEGEINAMYRPSGHPGLWFMGGNLALCRTYSRFLALQIIAREMGWSKP